MMLLNNLQTAQENSTGKKKKSEAHIELWKHANIQDIV